MAGFLRGAEENEKSRPLWAAAGVSTAVCAHRTALKIIQSPYNTHEDRAFNRNRQGRTMPRKTLFTLTEAANRIGISRQALHRYTTIGAITPIELPAATSKRLYFTLKELQRFQAIPRKVGRKGKEKRPKQPLGRPRNPVPAEPPPKKPRGRPRKNPLPLEPQPKRPRGRPKKQPPAEPQPQPKEQPGNDM